jgi:16S rRNA (uracil1498-N3)-methyltransferase
MASESRAPRFFVDPDAAAIVARAPLELPAAVARHAAQVLRLRLGDDVVVFDGSGGEYAASILRIDKRGVTIEVGTHRAIERELATPVRLVQAVLAADMMDLVIRKSVELGASTIVPVLARRSQALSDERTEKRVAHWRQIVVAACEQCGRNRVPRVESVQTLASWIAQTPIDGSTVALLPNAALPFGRLVAEAPASSVVIGPEGGLTEHEAAALTQAGARAAHLGVTTLRAETAAIAALALIATSVDEGR